MFSKKDGILNAILEFIFQKNISVPFVRHLKICKINMKKRKNYQFHVEEKEFTNKMFMKDQERSGQNGFLCCFFDLQKVLNTPWGNIMLLFYSRKLAYHRRNLGGGWVCLAPLFSKLAPFNVFMLIYI
jgi:hypothetical protein